MRIGMHFVIGTSLIALMTTKPARAAVIYSGLLNTTIPTDFTGVNLTIDGGVINLFFGGVGVANDGTIQPYRDDIEVNGIDNSDTLHNFSVGDTINASNLNFATGYGGSQDHLGSTFTSGQEGYIGLKITNGEITNYGWIRVVFTNNTGGALVKEWAYDDGNGNPIVVGGIRQVGSDILLTADFTLSSSSALTGTTNVIKSGNNTTTILSGNNTYTGTTSINSGTLALASGASLSGTNSVSVYSGGTLALASGASLSGTSSVSVNSGGTLAGLGSITGATTIQASGSHSPGSEIGIQTFSSNLGYLSNSILNFQLIATTDLVGNRGSHYDGINVNGLLSIASGVTSNLVFNAIGSSVDWTNSFWDSNHSWLVFDNANPPSLGSESVFTTINTSNDSYNQSFSLTGGAFTWSQTGNDIFLVYTVPEPEVLSILLLSGLLMLRRRRRH